MPIYEYVCDKCESRSEALRPMRDADARIDCEKCGSKMHRVHSVFAAATSSGSTAREAPMGPCGGCPNPGACGFSD